MNHLQFNIAQIKIDLMIRQSLYFGQTIEQNFEPVITQQIMGSFIKDSCEIILSTMERKSSNPDVNQELLDVFHSACCNELGGLYTSLQLLTGIDIQEFHQRAEVRIKDTVMSIASTLRMLVANPKSIILVK